MKRSGLVLLVAALLGGGGIGYVIGVGTAPPQGSTPAAGPSAPPPAAHERSAEAPMPSAADHGSLEEWLAAIPLSESKRGDGEITGTVTTPDGSPVAGVLIRGTLYRAVSHGPSVSTGAPPTDQSLSEVVHRAVDSHRRSLTGRVETRTGADGKFRLTGLADGKHSVQGWREGYRVYIQGSSLVPVGSDVRFEARPFLMVAVRILLPDGSESESGTVRISAGSGPSSNVSWRRDAPRIEMRPGTWSVSAWAGEHGEFRSESVEVIVEAGAPMPAIELRCKAVRGVRGSVIMPAGAQLPSISVAAIRLAAGSPADPGRLIRSPHSEHIWGNRSTYSFTDIEPGTWLVGVVENSRKVLVSETVVVGDGMAVLDLQIPEADRSEFVVVTVLGPDGKPIERVSFETEYQTENSSSSGGSREEKIGPGKWRVWHHTRPEEYDEGGKYGIEAKTTKYGSMRITYDRESTSELTFRFEEPAILVVTVSGYVGSGMEGLISLSLSARNDDRSNDNVGVQSQLSAEGVMRFQPAPPGEYNLSVFIQRDRHRNILAETVPVTLGAGENHQTVVTPRVYTLTVITEGMPGEPRLRLRPRVRGGIWWGTDRVKPKDGRVVFERIPAGEYVIEVDGGMEMMFVSVPGKAIVRFEGSPINALAVSITKNDGGLAKAGFRDGDLIIGIDGTEFTDMMQMQSLFGPAMAKEKTTFNVLRGGSRIAIELNMREMMQGDDGGNMEPTSR